MTAQSSQRTAVGIDGLGPFALRLQGEQMLLIQTFKTPMFGGDHDGTHAGVNCTRVGHTEGRAR